MGRRNQQKGSIGGPGMVENKKALNIEGSVPDSSIPQIGGFVKLYRRLLNWEWYSDLPVRVLFLHCLLKANFKDTKWKGQTIKTGQFITSIASLSRETALTQQQIRTALWKLKSTGEITNRATSRYSIITVNSWNKWQSEQQTEQQSSNKQITTDEEYKEYKNIYRGIKLFQKPTIEEIKNYCLERKNSINPIQFFNYYESKGWLIGKNQMKDWKACIRTWEQNQNKSKNNITIEQEGEFDYDNTPYRAF